MDGLLFNGSQWLRPIVAVDAANADYVKVMNAGGGVCALTASAGVRCFRNPAGDATWVATGTAGELYTDASPLPELQYADLVGPYEFHCALTVSGQRQCGGYHQLGSFGDGFDERQPMPVLLPGG